MMEDKAMVQEIQKMSILYPMKSKESYHHIKFRKIIMNRRCSIKKTALKNFEIFTEKHLSWSLFLIKMQAFRPSTLLNRDCNAGIFLIILKNF